VNSGTYFETIDINGLEAPPELGGHVIAVDNAVKMAIDKRQERMQSNPGTPPSANPSSSFHRE
jgi:hypothetical protein